MRFAPCVTALSTFHVSSLSFYTFLSCWSLLPVLFLKSLFFLLRGCRSSSHFNSKLCRPFEPVSSLISSTSSLSRVRGILPESHTASVPMSLVAAWANCSDFSLRPRSLKKIRAVAQISRQSGVSHFFVLLVFDTGFDPNGFEFMLKSSLCPFYRFSSTLYIIRSDNGSTESSMQSETFKKVRVSGLLPSLKPEALPETVHFLESETLGNLVLASMHQSFSLLG